MKKYICDRCGEEVNCAYHPVEHKYGFYKEEITPLRGQDDVNCIKIPDLCNDCDTSYWDMVDRWFRGQQQIDAEHKGKNRKTSLVDDDDDSAPSSRSNSCKYSYSGAESQTTDKWGKDTTH